MSWGHQIWRYWQTFRKTWLIIFLLVDYRGYFSLSRQHIILIYALNYPTWELSANDGSTEYPNHPLQKLSSQVCTPHLKLPPHHCQSCRHWWKSFLFKDERPFVLMYNRKSGKTYPALELSWPAFYFLLLQVFTAENQPLHHHQRVKAC